MSYNSLQSELITQLLLQETSGTTFADASGNARTGTLSGSTGLSTDTGPTSWLASAIKLDGTDDRIDVILSGFETSDFGVGCWSRSMVAIVRTLVSIADKDVVNQQHRINTTGGGDYSISTFDGSLAGADSTEDATGATWKFVSGNFTRTVSRELFVDGVSAALDETASSETGFDRLTLGVTADSTPGGYSDGYHAGLELFPRALSAAEWLERSLGPEPLNTVLPTLTINATSFSGTVGTWDGQSNGTVTYAWELRNASDDSVVDSGTGSSISGSGAFSGGYYLWVRASNDGGHDADEDSISTTATVAASSYPFSFDLFADQIF